MDAQVVLQATAMDSPSMPPDDAGKPSLTSEPDDGRPLQLEYDSDAEGPEHVQSRRQASPLDSEFGYFDSRSRPDPKVAAQAVARREARRVDAAPARPAVDIPRGPGPVPQAASEEIAVEAPRPVLRDQTQREEAEVRIGEDKVAAQIRLRFGVNPADPRDRNDIRIVPVEFVQTLLKSNPQLRSLGLMRNAAVTPHINVPGIPKITQALYMADKSGRLWVPANLCNCYSIGALRQALLRNKERDCMDL